MALADSQLFSSDTLAAGEEALAAQQIKSEVDTEKEEMAAQLKDRTHL